MLWPIMLPLKITLAIFVVIVVVVPLILTRFRCKLPKTFAFTFLISCLSFIPSCVGIQSVIDQQRFGVFDYAQFSDITDAHVLLWLPSTAKSITVEQFASGFRAKYKISQDDLDAHFDQQWNRYGSQSMSTREEAANGQPVAASVLEHEFGSLNWKTYDDVVEYQSPVAANGAGYSIWYSPSQGIAFQSAGYW